MLKFSISPLVVNAMISKQRYEETAAFNKSNLIQITSCTCSKDQELRWISIKLLLVGYNLCYFVTTLEGVHTNFPAAASGLLKHDENPSFEWIGGFSPDEVPKLKITFPDGGEDDVAILQRFNPIPVGPLERSENVDNCIFHGYLLNEKDVYVTVTGCPDSRSLQVLQDVENNME